MANYDDWETMDKKELENQKLQATVNQGPRKFQNRLFGILFICNIVANVISGSILFTEQQDIKKVAAAASCITWTQPMGEILMEYPGYLFGYIILAYALAIGAIFYLKSYARCATWTFTLARPVVLVILAIYIMADDGAMGLVCSLLIYAVILLLFIWKFKKSVHLAGELLKESTTSMVEKPGVIIVGSIMNALYMCYMFYFIFGYAAGGTWGKFDSSCEFIIDSGADLLMKIFLWTTIWMIFWSDAVRLYMSSVNVGYWYFDIDSAGKWPAWKGLKWALTVGMGSNAIAGVFLTFVSMLKRRSKKTLGNMITPLHFALFCIAKCLLRCCKMLSDFTTCVSAITGMSFWSSTVVTAKMMKRHFADGFVATTVMDWILKPGSYIMSLVIFFLTWVSIAGAEGDDPFNPSEVSNVDSTFKIIFWIFGFLLHYEPYFGLFIILMWPIIFTATVGSAFLIGLIAGILSYFILMNMSGLIGNSTTAVFVCYAMDKDNGGKSAKTKQITDNVLSKLGKGGNKVDVENK